MWRLLVVLCWEIGVFWFDGNVLQMFKGVFFEHVEILHVLWFIDVSTCILYVIHLLPLTCFCLQGFRLVTIVEALLIQGLSSSLVKSCLVCFGLSMISKRKIWVSFQTQSHTFTLENQLGSNPRNLWETQIQTPLFGGNGPIPGS